MKTKFLLLLLFVVLSILSVSAQTDYTSFYERSLRTNTTGMYVLGTWAVANMATGALGWSRSTGQAKYFHQMNLFWNTVNLSIAGFALYSNLTRDISAMTGPEMLDQHTRMENLYLINAGLDVLYIGAGFYLKHLGTQKPHKQDLLNGYGHSVIFQGGFLFLFDLVMYGLQHTHRMDFAENIQVSFLPALPALQVGLTIPFK